jgi:hypothetical protein
MTDLGGTIAPKSDQLNADDFISGPRTIVVTKVSADMGSTEQPILIHFEGDNGKPFKPCKSMRRVLVHVWGREGGDYPGRAMTLYRDPEVKWGGMAVGGIRISHMSGITEPVTMALTATKQSRKPYTVQPLADAPKATPAASDETILAYRSKVASKIGEATDAKALGTWWNSAAEKAERKALPGEVVKELVKTVTDKINELKTGNSAPTTE